jgi:flavoprotein
MDHNEVKIAWGITGAGHYLQECLAIIRELSVETHIFLSRAAGEVLDYYRLRDRFQQAAELLIMDKTASCQKMTLLYQGDYRLLVIAPATANSVAKMACGIADTLITNLFAQAGKLHIPALVLPCDIADEIESPTPAKKSVFLHSRRLDLDNNARLSAMDYVTVLKDTAGLRVQITGMLQ